MIKIAVCDDSAIDLQLIECMIKSYAQSRQDIEFQITVFENAFKLLEYVETSNEDDKFDIYLLDVIMPSINGIETGSFIRKYDEMCHIIFITASEDYALDSYDVIASGYIVKPVSKQKLFATLDRVISKLSKADDEPSGICIKTKNGIRNIPVHTIRYAEYIGHAIKFSLFDGTEISTVTGSLTMSGLAGILSKDKRFVCPHRAFIVNMKYISAMKGQQFILDNSAEIPVSRNSLKSVKQIYNNYINGQKG